eukprot:scaffold13874_cov63-Phaeocystis_antarctica.AAC.5
MFPKFVRAPLHNSLQPVSTSVPPEPLTLPLTRIQAIPGVPQLGCGRTYLSPHPIAGAMGCILKGMLNQVLVWRHTVVETVKQRACLFQRAAEHVLRYVVVPV